ncbi:hypothetical protein P8452_45907 [Trifolium repens]|nr:hypothetical protein P8452_45907 [Trifolium repens]
MLCGGNQQRQTEGRHRSNNSAGWSRWRWRWLLTNVSQRVVFLGGYLKDEGKYDDDDDEVVPLAKLPISIFTCKTLSMCLDTLKLHTKDHEVGEVNQLQRLYSDIHIFHNLTYLQMPFTDNLDLMVQVLHHCPKLQVLELDKEPIFGSLETVESYFFLGGCLNGER